MVGIRREKSRDGLRGVVDERLSVPGDRQAFELYWPSGSHPGRAWLCIGFEGEGNARDREEWPSLYGTIEPFKTVRRGTAVFLKFQLTNYSLL